MTTEEKIRKQMEPYKKGQAERRAGRLMIALCRENPQAEEIIGQDIDQEALSLAKCTDKVRQAARKQARENKLQECEFDDEDYLEIICGFYGIGGELRPIPVQPRPARKTPVSFLDLL